VDWLLVRFHLGAPSFQLPDAFPEHEYRDRQTRLQPGRRETPDDDAGRGLLLSYDNQQRNVANLIGFEPENQLN